MYRSICTAHVVVPTMCICVCYVEELLFYYLVEEYHARPLARGGRGRPHPAQGGRLPHHGVPRVQSPSQEDGGDERKGQNVNIINMRLLSELC